MIRTLLRLLPFTLISLGMYGCTQVSRNLQVDERVSEALERLEATPGGRRLAAAIEAHGGLANWYNNGDLQFRWTYNLRDLGPESVIDTLQIVDPWTARTAHEVPDSNVRFGWDGENAWLVPPDAEFTPDPGFWALTPYHFMSIPFVLAEPGTHHELLPEQIEFEGRKYDQVRVSFDQRPEGAPRDPYIVLIDPESHRVKGVRYTANPGMLYPEATSPEKLFTYEVQNMVNGVLFPSSHRSFDVTDGKVGEEIRDAQVSDLEYLPHEEARFAIPEDARIL